MPGVARRLLGKPGGETRREWRYGRHSSLKIDLAAGTWKDFEQDEGGGVLDLVERERSTDKAGALDWLKQEGFLNGQTKLQAIPNSQQREPDPIDNGKPQRKRAQVSKLSAAAVPAENTPARNYLTRWRMAWPIGGQALPGSVRWIAAEAVVKTLCWPNEKMPSGEWAGTIAFSYGAGEALAWKLEALTAQGRPVQPRWRRNIGGFKGLRFETVDHGGGWLHVAEGELTALALAVQCAAQGEGFSIAAGGAAGFQIAACEDAPRRPVRIHADRDKGGRIAARRLVRELRESGRPVEADGLYRPGESGIDAADVLAAEVGERASILEHDGGLPRDESDRRAWADALDALRQRRLHL